MRVVADSNHSIVKHLERQHLYNRKITTHPRKPQHWRLFYNREVSYWLQCCNTGNVLRCELIAILKT